ncbi:MAG: 4'-phosphopantetheinyl transferase superfamily protein [Hyphomicrobiales bacterium]|nr:4'-phosphopantetheinyl transferase superfamily protein [Hyphomicrobiales bacterium]
MTKDFYSDVGVLPGVFHAGSSFAASMLDVWRVDLRALGAHETALLSLLPAAEAAPGERGLSRGALRLLLGAYLGCSPEDVVLDAGAHGKPALARRQGNTRDLRFNVSRSGSTALVAMTLGRDIGVDVERMRPVPKLMKIAHRYFSSEQCEQLEQLEPQKRDEEFLRLWSRFESLSKASGYGVQLLGAKRNMPPRSTQKFKTRDISWSAREGGLYLASVSVEGDVPHLRCRPFP